MGAGVGREEQRPPSSGPSPGRPALTSPAPGEARRSQFVEGHSALGIFHCVRCQTEGSRRLAGPELREELGLGTDAGAEDRRLQWPVSELPRGSMDEKKQGGPCFQIRKRSPSYRHSHLGWWSGSHRQPLPLPVGAALHWSLSTDVTAPQAPLSPLLHDLGVFLC